MQIDWEHLIERRGVQIAHLDWTQVSEECVRAPEHERARLWQEAGYRWANLAQDRLNILGQGKGKLRYEVGTSARLMVVSSETAGMRASGLGAGERVMDRLLPALGELARVPPWPVVCCMVRGIGEYDTYIQEVGGEVGLMPAGMFVSGPQAPPHIALLASLPKDHVRLVFAHELVHMLIHHRELPVWLEEGLCRHLERDQLLLGDLVFADERALDWNVYFRKHGAAEFWTGRSFRGEGAPASYVLALRMVRRMLAEGSDRFASFLLKASRVDAGNAACREVFGCEVADFARAFLGK